MSHKNKTKNTNDKQLEKTSYKETHKGAQLVSRSLQTLKERNSSLSQGLSCG